MATPSKKARAAKRRAEYLRRTAAQAAARKGGWAVEGDPEKGLTLHLGVV